MTSNNNLRYNHFYENHKDIKQDHIFVFTSARDGTFTSSSGVIATRDYARTLKNNVGFEKTHKGMSFGIVTKEDNFVNTVPLKEIEHKLRVLYYLAIEEPDLSLVLSNISRGLKEDDALFVNKICKELFTNCKIENKFFLPVQWKKFIE